MPMLTLPAELTQTQARACLGALAQGLRAAADATVVVDASALQRFDSAALAVLLELRRQSLALGKTFAVARMPARLADLATLYGIGELLAAAPSAQAPA
jgi:phospholipid transport system transporter-binding protein